MACDGEIIVMAISEHVENAGTHSGDATMVLPAQDINNETRTNIESIATAVAKALNVSGNDITTQAGVTRKKLKSGKHVQTSKDICGYKNHIKYNYRLFKSSAASLYHSLATSL